MERTVQISLVVAPDALRFAPWIVPESLLLLLWPCEWFNISNCFNFYSATQKPWVFVSLQTPTWRRHLRSPMRKAQKINPKSEPESLQTPRGWTFSYLKTEVTSFIVLPKWSELTVKLCQVQVENTHPGEWRETAELPGSYTLKKIHKIKLSLGRKLRWIFTRTNRSPLTSRRPDSWWVKTSTPAWSSRSEMRRNRRRWRKRPTLPFTTR